jgi:hypothetical protein
VARRFCWRWVFWLWAVRKSVFGVARRVFNRKIFLNSRKPRHLTIWSLEHVRDGFVFDGRRRNKFALLFVSWRNSR